MKVTDIKQQVKRPDRYSVYIDDRFAFGMNSLELSASIVRVGAELTTEDVAALKDSAELSKAYDRALGYIVLRPRSERELLQYLNRKKYDPEIIAEVMARLEKRGYIDDQKFARQWIESRRLLKATSKRRLIQELRAKGVASEIIQQSLANDETTDAEVLKDLITRKRQQTRYQDDMKLMQYLSRQGYGYDDIKRAMQGSEDDLY